MAESRYIPAGVMAALLVLCRGTCYEPSCTAPAMAQRKGRWIRNLQAAHMAALERGGPRYDDLPTGMERHSFNNMILLCIPCHELVDKLKPEKYPFQLPGRRN